MNLKRSKIPIESSTGQPIGDLLFIERNKFGEDLSQSRLIEIGPLYQGLCPVIENDAKPRSVSQGPQGSSATEKLFDRDEQPNSYVTPRGSPLSTNTQPRVVVDLLATPNQIGYSVRKEINGNLSAHINFRTARLPSQSPIPAA